MGIDFKNVRSDVKNTGKIAFAFPYPLNKNA